MALTANRNVDHYIDQELRTYAVGAAKHVYKGALVGIAATGYAQPLSAGDRFAGIAYEECDNSAGAAAAKTVRVYTLGDFGHSLTGAAITDVGRPVFASDDATLTFAAVGNSYVGIVQDFVSTGNIILRIDPEGALVKTVTHAVENLSAGADIAARAIHSFTHDAWIVAARVVNQATAAAGIDGSNTCVVAVAIDAGTVASETFDGTPAFPAANAVASLGAITNPHAAKGDVLTLAVTNGTTADPGPFLVEVDYV
ncbi:MAG: hypothetical protein HY763_02190 [Planctomycetes bacterium]|nr:hypothetical protein [Planctomycetota bacterium]